MKKKSIITALLALVTIAGYGQVKCHVEGTLETDAWGDEIIICEAGTDLRVVDEPRFHVKAKDGRFTYDIETDYPRLYNIFFLKQYETGRWFSGKFLTENCNVNITMYEDKRVRVVSTGEEGRKHEVKDSIEDARFWNPVQEIDDQLEDQSRIEEFYKADFISTIKEARAWDMESLPKSYVDSIRQVIDHYMQDKRAKFTAAGWLLQQRRDSITDGLRPFRLAYAEEHPMLWTLYDVLDAIQVLNHANNDVNLDPSQWEPYLTLYHNKYIKCLVRRSLRRCGKYSAHPIASDNHTSDNFMPSDSAVRIEDNPASGLAALGYLDGNGSIVLGILKSDHAHTTAFSGILGNLHFEGTVISFSRHLHPACCRLIHQRNNRSRIGNVHKIHITTVCIFRKAETINIQH